MNIIKAISIGFLSSDELKRIEFAVNEKKYNSNSNFGFDVQSVDSAHIKCQFIERIVNERTYETLDGVEEKIEYVDYYKMDFILRANSSFSLFLIDPPRNTKYGLQMIRSLIAGDAKLKSIEFDLEKMVWLANNGEKIKINSASISNLNMTNDILAKIKLVSNSNISEFVGGKYKDNSGCIDSLSGLVNGVPIEISKLGRIKISADSIEHVLNLLERFKVQKD